MNLGLHVVLAASVAVAVVAGACGGGEGDSRWLELLRHVPDTEAARTQVWLNDFAAVRERLGISLPSLDADEDALSEYVHELQGVGVDLTGFGFVPPIAGFTGIRFGAPDTPGTFSRRRSSGPEDWREEVGFTIANVDQSIDAGRDPENYQMLRGRFDQDTIDAVVRSEPLFSDLLKEDSYHNVDFYTWGEDRSLDLLRRSSVRRLGRGHRLALDGDYLYWTTWTDGVKALIDTGRGERRSLADVEEYQLLANGLDQLDTFAALFTDYSMPLSRAAEITATDETPEAIERMRLQLLDQPMLSPYEQIATGAGFDADGAYTVIVILYADAEAADRNVSLLKRRIAETERYPDRVPWSEIYFEVEVTTQGRLLLAKLRTNSQGAWSRHIDIGARDLLFVYND